MHSGSLERAGTPRKRTLSRGMSEEESLRHIIKEAEESSKRLTRSDSRYGSLKRGERVEIQSEEDPAVGLPDMMDLQASYEDTLQEVRGLEVQREVLLFQVDCLQDALEGAEEMLAEAQREVHDLSMTLEQERERRKKLEVAVDLLKQEVEQLKEEKNMIPAVPVYTLVKSTTQDEGEVVEATNEPENEEIEKTSNKDEGQSQGAHFSVIRLNSVPATQTQSPEAEAPVESSARGLLSSLFKGGKGDQSTERKAGPLWLQKAPQGTSVDQDEDEEHGTSDSGSPGTSLRTFFNKTFGLSEQPSQANKAADSAGPTDQPAQDGDDNDESSTYEDARSDLQGHDDAATPDNPQDGGFPEEEAREEDGSQKNSIEPKSPKSPDSCILS
ncbi:uncharacterized protein si:ch1073-456m8.1 isoform X2 [Chanos chanos]|uniref:Uncharacterized protein si:ch1073-456m8.1 isoform X2 n=1 Tax=Chanos chanos TaxID=29144 RepID=A0A6J2VR79_CHACN|nr:uncharacterized protein LOC115814858 isoform X2 [Chanos chanos]